MTLEQERTLDGLKTAIQMEIDGKEFYLKASQESGNELGKKLLAKLAAEEDYHRRKFENIYNDIREERGWPSVAFEPDGGSALRTIFARAIDEMSAGVRVLKTELDAVEKAMSLENKTFDYYVRRGAEAGLEAERNFYYAVAGEEREHYLVLLDYYEYIKDPAAWFADKEHHSLDGG
ncbi:MAG: ferritin family protein [Dehalococcoidia bacterium]|jgi:rubrerythrin